MFHIIQVFSKNIVTISVVALKKYEVVFIHQKNANSLKIKYF